VIDNGRTGAREAGRDAGGRLVVRAPNHIGELVLALPALEHAAGVERQAGRRLLVQVIDGLLPVLGMTDLEADVLSIRRRHGVVREGRRLARRGARRGILLTPSASSALIFRLAGVRARRGTAGGWRTWLLTDAVPRAPLLRGHRVHEFLALVGGRVDGEPPVPRIRRPPAGTEAEDMPPPLRGLLAAGAGPIVGLVPGANGESRRWPADRFASLARRLADAGRTVVVLGGPGEEPLTAAVCEAAAAGSRCVDLGGRTTLHQLARTLTVCDVLVTNDTGPMHLAAALGRPVVALEGPADVRQTRPLGPRVRLVGSFDLPCVPCVKNRCPRSGRGTVLAEADRECMRLITVDAVEEAAEGLLREDDSGE